MSKKTTLSCHTAEGDEPACHLDEEFGESGAAYLDLDHIGIKLLAPEPCLREAADVGLARAVLENRAEIWRKETRKRSNATTPTWSKTASRSMDSERMLRSMESRHPSSSSRGARQYDTAEGQAVYPEANYSEALDSRQAGRVCKSDEGRNLCRGVDALRRLRGSDAQYDVPDEPVPGRMTSAADFRQELRERARRRERARSKDRESSE